MSDVVLIGRGKMGRVVVDAIAESKDMSLVEYVGRDCFPTAKCDILIDFSAPEAVGNIFSYCSQNLIPAVIATTGYNDEQWNTVIRLSKRVPVFYSQNMSIGIAAVMMAIKRLSLALKDCDIDIIEQHHRGKKDSPSGTALMLAGIIAEERNLTINPNPNTRHKDELNILSLRAGTTVGQHEVLFNMGDECISIKHTAHSRKIFAYGALNAARFIMGKSPALYTINDLL